MDSGLGQTVQSRDDSFYLYGRIPGTAPGQPFDMGQLLPDEEPLPAGEYLGQDSEGVGDHPFKVVDLGSGDIRVLQGTVNSVVSPIWETSAKPTEVWLSVILVSASDQSVQSCGPSGTEPSVSATTAKLRIANIAWDGNTPSISQFVSNSQSLASCGTTHVFGRV
jgi:hypothetical protein